MNTDLKQSRYETMLYKVVHYKVQVKKFSSLMQITNKGQIIHFCDTEIYELLNTVWMWENRSEALKEYTYV